ncbi:MAG: DUF488 family protein [Candidatus Zixiibacteriota bacterium]
MEQKSMIFTIGYQGYSLSELVNTLKKRGIDTLVDVRYDAYSKRPEFCKGRLRSAIQEARIEYIHRPELGTPTQLRKKITDARSGQEVFRLYFERISKVNYRYVEAVAELASQRRVALMCMEKEPERCHRKILADFLSRKFRFEVVHLAPSRKARANTEDPQLSFDL